MLLKSGAVEIVCGVENLRAADLITAQEAMALASFYGWEMPR